MVGTIFSVSISAQQDYDIPDWIKNTAGWWATDAISENEFLNAIEFLIKTGIIVVNNDDDTAISSILLTWDEIVTDAKYSNDGSLDIKKYYFGDSNIMLTTMFNADDGTFLDETSLSLLNSGLALYKITGDELYLTQAKQVANTLENILLLDDGRSITLHPITKEYSLAYNHEVLLDVALLALIDPTYTDLVKKLADNIVENEINADTNLFYKNFLQDGTPNNPEMYLSYRGSVGLESLMLAYEVTDDDKYLNQVKKSLLSYWSTRHNETNLIPSSINAYDKSVEREFMQQYGAGIFIKLLLHYYYLTDDPEILKIMNDYADAVLKYFWDGKTWNYRVNYDGSILSSVLEANYAKLDDSLILLYDLNPEKFNRYFEYAKQDYDNSFQNNFNMENNLAIHSVKDDGSKDSPQSMMQYAFIINQNVGSRLFQVTNDTDYLVSLNDFYHSIIKNHKRDQIFHGYILGIDAYTLDNTSLGVILNQRAPGMISNKINLTFMPLDNVEITWTKIGNYELSEPFITTFSDSGRFNSIDFNYNEKSIFFHNVHNKGQIIFADEIKSVIVDNENYANFDSHTLNTLDGTHQYLVFLK